jgi:hypothetical protein
MALNVRVTGGDNVGSIQNEVLLSGRVAVASFASRD